MEVRRMSDVEVVTVPRDQSVADLVNAYAEGLITYGELEQSFWDRGWSTLSLYENTRHIDPPKTTRNRE
jgi:hypothetical protein